MIVSRPGNVPRSRRCASISAVSSPAWVEAAAMTVRSPIAACSAFKLVGVGRRRRHVELEVAGGGDTRRAEIADSGRHRRPIARGRDRSSAAAPRSCAGTRRQRLNERSDSRPLTRISGMPRCGAGHDQVRPQIGFDEQREIGPPVIEEARDEARRVERHELVDDARRQPLLGEFGRGHRAGGAQHVEVPRADALDQRDDREQFADARAVHPDQRARRARDLALAAALAQPRRMLLAALEPMRDEQPAQAASPPPSAGDRRAASAAAAQPRLRSPRGRSTIA